MNRLSLLTKSHTFEDARDRRGTYKLSEHPLPKLANSKGPAFAPEHPAEPLQTGLFEQPQPRPAAKAAAPPQLETSGPIGSEDAGQSVQGQAFDRELLAPSGGLGKKIFFMAAHSVQTGGHCPDRIGLGKSDRGAQ